MEIAVPQLLRESAASADPVRMARDEEIADASFRAADFASLDREHLSVQGCLFTGCLFAGSVLARSQFSDVVFRNCDFSNADLLGCSLHRVRFADCKLSGTNFAETALNHLLFERCKGEFANFAFSRVRTVRATQRKRREREPLPAAAVVGYTNAGKSSLINRLAGSSLLSEDKLFATLDPTTRRLDLPGGAPLLLTDTVGFVRKLPHRFVEAFKATLEEAVLSDFLVHVIDVSSPDAPEHARTTLGVLKELGADEKRTLTVFNKIDIAPDGAWRYALSLDFPDAVEVSARTGRGMEALLARLEEAAGETSVFMRLLIPHSRYEELALLHSRASVASQKYADGGVEAEAHVPAKYAGRFRKWEAR